MTANLAKFVPVAVSIWRLPVLCEEPQGLLVDYATVKGFEVQRLGHTITAIFDRSTDTEKGFISCFAEPEEAAKFLTYKRGC